MRDVVVDTNILVRAFLKPDCSDGKVVQLAFNETLQLWYSNGLLIEFIRVLFYPRFKKYQVNQERVRRFLDSIVAHGNSIIPLETKRCRDENDNEILGIAMAVAADAPVALVSADKDILVLKGSVEGVQIMTPQEFLRTL